MTASGGGEPRAPEELLELPPQWRSRARDDPGIGGEHMRSGRAAPGQRMTRAHEDVQRIVEEVLLLELGTGNVLAQGADQHVSPPVAERIEQHLVGALEDRDLVTRKSRAELECRGGHEPAARQRHRADHGTSRCWPAQRIDLGARLRELAERETRPPREALRLAGRPHPERGRLEQRNPEPSFELPRSPVQRRSHDTRDPGSGAESSVLGDRRQRMQLRGRHEVRRAEHRPPVRG
jgi:hypothetical protein